MKKTLLFLFAIVLAMATMAQPRTFFLQESFNGSAMPSGWTISGSGTSNWAISATQHAGGEANEMVLNWSPQFNGTSRLVSPAVDLTGVNSVIFSFKHTLDNYQGTNTIGIATTSDGGTTWHEAWSHGYNNSWTLYSVAETITTEDMGHNNVQFCIYYSGNSYNINGWYFDDIAVFTLEDMDLAVTKVNTPDFYCSEVPGQLDVDVNVGFSVMNYGLTPINSVQATYLVEGQDPVTETFNVNIPSLGTEILSFGQAINLNPDSYDLTVTIDKVNGEEDDVAENNIATKSFSVAMSSADMIPMIEHFSSSTCGPCVSVNTQMLNFCNNNEGRFTYTKYQMNWPGNGDPYYTNEGGVRRDFYGVNAVPQCFLDGEDQGYAAVTQATFDNHAARRSVFDVRGSFEVSGNTINVIADVVPYVNVSGRVFISVNEKETHNNVGSNGETSFHHIFMKMLPDAQGIAVDFVSGKNEQFSFSFDMSSTHVEEMSDLEVSIWVQNMNSHEVYNSHFAYGYSDHPYPVENLTLVNNGGTLEASWDAAPGALGYNVYKNGLLELSNTQETTYSFPEEPGKYYVVEVVALYPGDKTSIKSAVTLEGGTPVLCDPVTDLVAVYSEYNGQHGAEVSWTEPEDVVSYEVYVGEELLGNVSSMPIFIGFDGEPAGLYTIIIVAVYDDCVSDMAKVDFEWDPTSVGETALVGAIYPNPTSGSFKIQGRDIASVAVYNLMGQKVFESANGTLKPSTMQSGFNQETEISIDATGWEKGIYMITLTGMDGRAETRKLIVE